jgi:hypothetical protein
MQNAGWRTAMKVLQHYFNALHVYCVLRRFGFSRDMARRAARYYESLSKPLLYCKWSRNAVQQRSDRVRALPELWLDIKIVL